MELNLNQVQKNSIIQNERGILAKKGRGFHFPSTFAKENLPHLLWCDEFICDDSYSVDRESLGCYMMMNILVGKMTVKSGGKTYTANDGNLIFLDLRKKHYYKAETTLQVQQYMVDGNPFPAYYQLVTEKNGPIFPKDSRLSFTFSGLKNETMKEMPNDHIIAQLFCGIFSCLCVNNDQEIYDPIRQAKYYINDHYSESISLDGIAKAVSLSKYYFSRQFEKDAGITPWEYLTKVRVENAMRLLTNSNLTVDEIANRSGFSDSTHFIRAFKKINGITPGVFRRYFNDVNMGLESANE